MEARRNRVTDMDKNFDYMAPLDRPEIDRLVFHPVPDPGFDPPDNATDRMIPVDADVEVGCRFYSAAPDKPTILFFHGNGEIAADYDDIAPWYNRYGMNFLIADYRGYGKSSGNPSGRALLHDAHLIYQEVKAWLSEEGYNAPLFVMGRSLGSASALEIASEYQRELRGLILESAFAETLPLLRLLGVDPEALGATEENGFGNLRKIGTITKPTLIIHAQRDNLIPFQQAELLMEKSPAHGKQLTVVPGADHNNILMRAGEEYFKLIGGFVKRYARD